MLVSGVAMFCVIIVAMICIAMVTGILLCIRIYIEAESISNRMTIGTDDGPVYGELPGMHARCFDAVVGHGIGLWLEFSGHFMSNTHYFKLDQFHRPIEHQVQIPRCSLDNGAVSRSRFLQFGVGLCSEWEQHQQTGTER